MKIDIGGGLAPRPGYVNLDPVHGSGEFRRRIQDGIPLGDGSVEAAACSHLLEHIPAGAERLFVFDEVWRVLRPGALWEIAVPLFGGWGAIADPTHVSFWVRESFDYFTGRVTPAAEYGIRFWELVAWSEVACEWGQEGHATMRKPG